MNEINNNIIFFFGLLGVIGVWICGFLLIIICYKLDMIRKKLK